MVDTKIKSILRTIGGWFPGLKVFIRSLGLVYSKRSMLKKHGWIESVKYHLPRRVDGSPVPWMNYNVIDFLEERLNKKMSMFEFGSGNSTLFYAARVNDITSLEVDKGWYDYCIANMPENVTLLYQNFDAPEKYTNVIVEQNHKFNVVIVDAEVRVDCVKIAAQCLTDDGVIILDDAHRDYYQEAFDFACQQGFRKINFKGLKPAGIREYGTTIFYRSDNCLGI
jgi:hypothetical protein